MNNAQNKKLVIPAMEQELKKMLGEKDLLSDNAISTLEILVTDAPERVYQVASRFFGSELKDKIKKVIL